MTKDKNYLNDGQVNQITKLINNNELEEALKNLKSYENSNIENPLYHNILAVITNQQGKLDESLDSLNKAISLDKNFIPAYRNRISLFLKSNKLNEAINDYKNILRVNDSDLNSLINIAILYDKTNNKEEALKFAKASVKVNNESEMAHYNLGTIIYDKKDTRTYEDAKNAFNKVIDLNSKNYNANIALGNIHFEEENIDAAFKYFKNAIELRPESGQAHFKYGNCLNYFERFDEAINSFKKAIELEPDLFGSYNNIGNTLVRLNRDKEAIPYYEKSIVLIKKREKNNSNNFFEAQAYYNLGVAHRKLDEIEIAEDYLNKSINLEKNFADAQSELASIKLIKKINERDHSSDNIALAVSDFDKLIDKNLKVDKKLINDLKLKIKRREYKDIISICSKIIEYGVEIPSIYIVLSYSHFLLLEIDDAIEAIDKGIALKSNQFLSYKHKALIYLRLNKFEECIAIYNYLLENDNLLKNENDKAETLTLLGNIYRRMENQEKAIELYNKAITIAPDYSYPQSELSQVLSSVLKDDSIEASYKSLRMVSDDEARRNKVKLSRLKHDVEQAKFLASNNFKAEPILNFIEMGNSILSNTTSDAKYINLNDKIQSDIFMNYQRLPIIYQTKPVKHFLNQNNDWQDIEQRYLNAKPEFIVIDNFLSNECIIELRKFCLYSKVFLREYENQYLGAFGNKGFTSEIHLGIANDLQKKLPNICGGEYLNHMWAFKYDSKLGSGINVHADFAKVNLNFWITPDDYNLKKNSGGLIVYDTPPPNDWTFEKYNSGKEEIYSFLKKEKAKKLVGHYKYNRAILFNSALFHETEEIDFENVYAGRRVNVTYLFGRKSNY